MRGQVIQGGALLHREESIETTRQKADFVLIMIPLILSLIGILMIVSTTSRGSFSASGSSLGMGNKQIVAFVLGIAGMVISYLFPIKFWKVAWPLSVIVALFLIVLTITPVGSSVGGAKRWLNLGFFMLQPSEIMSFAIVFWGASIANRENASIGAAKRFLAAIVIPSALLLLQPDLGSSMLIFAILMGIYMEKFGVKLPLIALAIAAVLVFILIIVAPYRARRLAAFSDPWSDPLNIGYQTIQGLIAPANGGLWGTGIGHGLQKLNYLPAAYTDFIYAAIGEELGLIGTLSILAMIMIWMMRSRRVYNMAEDGFTSSVAWGMVLSLIIPFYINIAGVTKMLPLTGMPLPFLSYGGTSMVMAWVKVGVLLRIQKDSSNG